MRLRILSAAILIASVLTIIGMDGWRPLLDSPGLWLLPVMFFFLVGTAWEFGLLVSRKFPISPAIPGLLTGLVIACGSLPMIYVAIEQKPYPEDCPIGIPGWVAFGLIMACSISSLIMLWNFRHRQSKVIECWALSSLIPLYVAGLGSFWILIRLNGTPSRGLMNLVGIIAVTKITDAAAYFVGRSLGRHQLCPTISPGKTIEGAIGGLVAGILASVGYFLGLVPWVLAETRPNSGWIGLVGLGILIGIFGMVGDLIESVVKRSVEAKDSGRLLPGLGGLWDVTDSLLPTAAIGYLGVLARWI